MDEERDIRQWAKHVPAVQDHSRLWRENRYVYPVISRRSRGLSIGINLNPEKACTFRCVYCQVDRRPPHHAGKVDMGTLIRELNAMLDWTVSGEIWKDPHFATVPEPLRRINDIAFSGDGEPTACRNFADAVQVAADAKTLRKLTGVRIVVISNATRFHTQTFRKAIPVLRGCGGEVWAKLDAGSPDYFARINRTTVPFKTVLENIEWLSKTMPIIVQTCLIRLDGQPPAETEIQLYCARLRHLLEAGGQIKGVQLYTVARPPAQRGVAALADAELDDIAVRVQRAVGQAPVETYYGADVPAQEDMP